MKIKIKSNEEKFFILLKFNNLPMKPIILELWEKKSKGYLKIPTAIFLEHKKHLMELLSLVEKQQR